MPHSLSAVGSAGEDIPVSEIQLACPLEDPLLKSLSSPSRGWGSLPKVMPLHRCTPQIQLFRDCDFAILGLRYLASGFEITDLLASLTLLISCRAICCHS